MDEKLAEDLCFQFNSSYTASSKHEHEDKGVLNFNHDGDSQNDIKDSSKQIIQNNCQSIHNENKENEDDFDTQNEDLLLCIKDGEGNFDEYEFSEEEENYLLREDCPEHYIKRGGMILWNADEYDFTSEQENILLSDDCPSNYLKNLGISNVNEVYTIDDEDKILCVDITPSLLNQNMIRAQEDRSSYISCSSNRNSSDGKEHKNLSSPDKDNEIIRSFSTIPMQQIKSKDLRYNSEIKSEIPSYFNDIMKKQDTVTNTDDENIPEIDIILDIEDVEDFFMNEDDENISQNLYNPYFIEPTEIPIPQKNCFSSKIMPSSSTLEDVKDHFSEDLNTDERVRDKEFDVSKVMKSDSARRAYLDLLKDKTDSLLRCYSKFKNSFLQSPSRIIEELEESFSEEVNMPTELHNDPKKMEIKSLNKNMDVLPLTNNPLIIPVENKTVQSRCQINNQAENRVECVKRRLTFSMQSTDEKDLTQLLDSEEIQDETLEQITPKLDDKYMKDILDKSVSEASFKEKMFGSVDGVVCNIPKESLPYGVIESRHSNISEDFSKEQQQNEDMENLCDLQNFNVKVLGGLGKCFTPDQCSISKEDTGVQERNVLNKASQKFTGGKFTEILDSHLFVGYEAVDFQSTNDDSGIVSDVNEIETTTSMNLRKRPKLNYATSMNLRKRPALNYATSMNLRKCPKLN